MTKPFKSTRPAESTDSGTTSPKSASTASVRGLQPTEADIQKTCIDWLNTIPGVKVWRQNTGAQVSEYKGKKRFIKFGQTGQADITGIGPHGVRIEIEVKRPGNKPTEDQQRWLMQIIGNGGIASCVTSVDECVQVMRTWFSDYGWPWKKEWEL